MKETKIHKENIRPKVIKILTAAHQRINLAIGWIGDEGLIGLLQKKAIEGVEVKLILVKDDLTTNQQNTFNQLMQKGVKIVWLDSARRELLMDHKFAIIDDKVVLTGNYTWGQKSSSETDFISISESMQTLATGFKAEFDYLSILNDLPSTETKPINPISDLLKKLELIKTLLGIGDTEFIHLRLEQLADFKKDENIQLIYDALSTKDYEGALELIKTFTQYHQTLRECIDPPIDRLLREIQLLEEEISMVSNEYSETQKKILEFSKMHTNRLGDLLQKILFQGKIKAEKEAKENAEKQPEYEEAKKDHEDYTKSYEEAKKQKQTPLSPEEKKELKKLYRQTSMKCHPDRVVNELREQAEEFFVALNQAYKANDLETVRSINQQLKSGIMLSKSEGITELKKLESTVKVLSQKLESWIEKFDELKETPSFRTVNSIEDWDTYFEDTKETLEAQLERLKEFNESVEL